VSDADASGPVRVAHVITTLVPGGTERALQRLVLATRPLGIAHDVISLTDGGTVADELRAAGVAVHSLGMARSGALPDAGGIARLHTLLRRLRPEVVQGWMYHANLLAGLVAPLATGRRALWGIRAASVPADRERRRTVLTAAVTARLARTMPRDILVNGERARDTHVAAGYPASRMTLIPNGYDLARWRPDDAARVDVRRELGIADDAPLVGMIANFRPIKDHATFLAAMDALRRTLPSLQVLVVGVDATRAHPAFAALADRTTLGAALHALGARSDVPRVTAALDVAVLTSVDESFPNVVAEAMACAVPVVSTDAGDARTILGSADDIVPVGDVDGVARRVAAWLVQPEATRRAHGRALRARVEREYGLDVVARRHADYWRAMAGAPSSAR
jgi:glycosyltransferase involved in cell wall biosynthesis